MCLNVYCISKLLKIKKYTAVKLVQLYIIYVLIINNNGIVATGLWLNRFGLVEGLSCQHTVLYCGLARSLGIGVCVKI